MEQYISKSALVAEIERRRKDWRYGSSIEAKYKREECDDILSLIVTLEVTEAQKEPVSNVWHDMIEEAENGRNIIIIDPKDFYGAVLRKGGTQLKNHNKERYVKWAYIDDIINVANKGEAVSKDRFAFKAIPRLLEMLEPNDRAKAYTNRLADALEKEGYNTDAKIVREKIRVMNGETVAMATMDEEPFNAVSLVNKWDEKFDELLEPYKDSRNYKNLYIKLRWWKQNCKREFLWKYKREEPVSKELEEAAIENARFERGDDTEVSYDINRYEGFIDGSNWQKEKDAKMIFNAKEEGYRLGKATMKQQLMNDAVECDVIGHGTGWLSFGYIPESDYDFNNGDKTKLIIIKEE